MLSIDKEKEKLEWYNDPSIVTNVILGLILLIIILSQSFAINNNMSTTDILSSILNHNSIYLLALVYFMSLKFSAGRKYFDFSFAFALNLSLSFKVIVLNPPFTFTSTNPFSLR